MPSGVYAAAITPHRERANLIDSGAAMEIIDFLCASGVDGIALLESSGNFVHFDPEERERFVTFAIKRSRKPVAVNVSHSTLEVTMQLAEQAADAGAAFVLVMPPYFYPYAGDMVEAYYRELRAGLDGGVPLYLYNMPFFTSPIPVEVAARLLDEGLYRGIQDSSGKPEYLAALGSGVRMVGNDAAIHSSRREAAGLVSGCAACMPELVVALDRAVMRGDEAAQGRLGARLSELMGWLDRFPVPFAIMEACRLRKLPARPDSSWLGSAPIEEFRSWFEGWLPEALRDAKEL